MSRHISTVSRNKPSVSSGFMTIGNAVSAVDLTMNQTDGGRQGKPDDGTEQRLTDDHLVNITTG